MTWRRRCVASRAASPVAAGRRAEASSAAGGGEVSLDGASTGRVRWRRGRRGRCGLRRRGGARARWDQGPARGRAGGQRPRRPSAHRPGVAGARPVRDGDPAAGREVDPVVGVGHRLLGTGRRAGERRRRQPCRRLRGRRRLRRWRPGHGSGGRRLVVRRDGRRGKNFGCDQEAGCGDGREADTQLRRAAGRGRAGGMAGRGAAERHGLPRLVARLRGADPKR